MEAPTMVLTFTRRSAITLFMALAMLWAVSVSSLAGSGEQQFDGYYPRTCTDGCDQNVSWE